MAVEATLPAERRQQPATPVKKATQTKKKETMKRAIIDRAMSAIDKKPFSILIYSKISVTTYFKCVVCVSVLYNNYI